MPLPVRACRARFVVASFAALLPCARLSAVPDNAQKPNIIFLLADDQRYDELGCTGDPIVKTPHIDRLAREGVLFENSFATSPVCMPNRTNWHYLTGTAPVKREPKAFQRCRAAFDAKIVLLAPMVAVSKVGGGQRRRAVRRRSLRNRISDLAGGVRAGFGGGFADDQTCADALFGMCFGSVGMVNQFHQGFDGFLTDEFAFFAQ
jgi:hypothetical protein